MMKKLLTILFFIVAIGWSSDAFADRSGECIRTGTAFSTRVATCTRAIIMQMVDETTPVFVPHAQRIAGFAILLALILFGAKMASGAINIHQVMPHLLILMLKIGLVVYILANYAQLAELPVNLLDEIIRISMSWIDQGNFFSQDTINMCEAVIGTSPQNFIGPLPPGQDGNMLTVWWNFDCMALMALGIQQVGGGAIQTSGVGAGSFIIGLLGIVIYALSSAGIGLLLIKFAVLLLIAVLGTIFRGLLVYVRQVLILAVLIILTPFFLPLVFFSHTKGYVEALFEIYLESIFQPAIFFAIISMFVMFLVLDGGPLDRLTTTLADLKFEKCIMSADTRNSGNSATAQCVEAGTGLQKVYNFLGVLVALVTPAVLATAMLGFADHSDSIAGLFARTPADAIGTAFNAIAPQWAQERVAYASNRFENYRKDLNSGRRGHYSHREFKARELELQQNLAGVEQTGYSDYEKGKLRKQFKDEYKEDVAKMKRVNAGKTNIISGVSMFLYTMYAKAPAKFALETAKHRKRGAKGSAKAGWKKTTSEWKSTLKGGLRNLNPLKHYEKDSLSRGVLARERRAIRERIEDEVLGIPKLTKKFERKINKIKNDNRKSAKQIREEVAEQKQKVQEIIAFRKRQYEKNKKSRQSKDNWVKVKATAKRYWYGNKERDI